jgi:putative ABC transport system substrate-binding protein
MRRREFIAGLSSAVACPVAARAQQPERMRRIGVLSYLASDDAEWQSRNAAFLQGLQELGWAVGRNARIDYEKARMTWASMRPQPAHEKPSRAASAPRCVRSCTLLSPLADQPVPAKEIQ